LLPTRGSIGNDAVSVFFSVQLSLTSNSWDDSDDLGGKNLWTSTWAASESPLPAMASASRLKLHNRHMPPLHAWPQFYFKRTTGRTDASYTNPSFLPLKPFPCISPPQLPTCTCNLLTTASLKRPSSDLSPTVYHPRSPATSPTAARTQKT
jgi:hypothetical protein